MGLSGTKRHGGRQLLQMQKFTLPSSFSKWKISPAGVAGGAKLSVSAGQLIRIDKLNF